MYILYIFAEVLLTNCPLGPLKVYSFVKDIKVFDKEKAKKVKKLLIFNHLLVIMIKVLQKYNLII